jgi:hypothetical protein
MYIAATLYCIERSRWPSRGEVSFDPLSTTVCIVRAHARVCLYVDRGGYYRYNRTLGMGSKGGDKGGLSADASFEDLKARSTRRNFPAIFPCINPRRKINALESRLDLAAVCARARKILDMLPKPCQR